MAITQNWLKNNANDSSYSRGRGYIAAVRKLKKDGNTYTAKVDGSETYEVEIIDAPSGIEADCTCPYDYDGICKHIVAVGLNIINGNFKEVKTPAAVDLPAVEVSNNEPIDAANFYKNEFLKAKKDKQEAFIKLLFQQNEVICRQFLAYIRPPAIPLSTSTDIEELSNEIAAHIMSIDVEAYLSDDDDYDSSRGYGRGRYDDYDDYDEEEGEQYDIEALEKEVLRLLKPYGKRAIDTLEKGHLLDSARIVLSIYESIYLVEDPELSEYEDFSYINSIDSFFEETAANWANNITLKTFKKADYEKILTLILDRWQKFKRFHGKENPAPYEYLDETFFETIIEKAKAQQFFLDFMIQYELHTANHYELTKKLCDALNKPDFLLEKLAIYGLDTFELAKELLQNYIKRDNRDLFVLIAQRASDKFDWLVNEFIAEQILPTDNLGFFKKIVSEVAARRQRLDLYNRWAAEVTTMEQEAYLELQKANNESFYIKILENAKRYSDLLIFAEQRVENRQSKSFETAAQLVFDVYPNEIFPLYCERILLRMGNAASSRDHYQTVVSELKPMKQIKGKTNDLKDFVLELRKKYTRLPAFLDELKRGGF